MNELKINTRYVRKRLVSFLKEEFKKRSFKRAVLGLSGGVDSSLVAALAKEALGAGNVLGIFMPYLKIKEDSRDAKALVTKIGIRFKIIDISPMIDIYFKNFPKADRIRRGNKMARERMAVLYDQSKEYDALVLGAGNRTEILLGYFTLYGDSACAINPIGSLYKTQVRQLAKALGVPKSIIDKKPSARLWPGQTDEGELGLAYRELDRLLYHMGDKKCSKAGLTRLGFSKESIDKVSSYIKNSEFKKQGPLIAKIF